MLGATRCSQTDINLITEDSHTHVWCVLSFFCFVLDVCVCVCVQKAQSELPKGWKWRLTVAVLESDKQSQAFARIFSRNRKHWPLRSLLATLKSHWWAHSTFTGKLWMYKATTWDLFSFGSAQCSKVHFPLWGVRSFGAQHVTENTSLLNTDIHMWIQRETLTEDG